MKELTAAIITLFNTTNDFKTAIGSRLYFDYAPQGTIFPYAVFSYPVGTSDNLFGGELVENILWQLSIFSKSTGGDPILTLHSQARALFDDATLNVSGYGNLLFLHENSYFLSEPADNVRQAVLEYRSLLEKN